MWEFITNEESIHAVLLTILLGAGVLTPVFIWRAKLNLEKEERAFHCCKKKIDELKRKTASADDPYEALVKDAGEKNMDSSASVQRYIYGGKSSEECELNSGYVSDRLYAILSSVSKDNLVRKAPGLSDLHELTMQRERGGICTSAFRTLAPGILVMGILGTLLGVHNKLDEVTGADGIGALAEALISGALAVFFTVVVMLFRGFYNRKLAEFISDFDEYTLTTLLVFFQPESQDNADLSKLHKILRDVKNGKQSMEKILAGVKRFHDVACESEADCASLLQKTQENLGNMGVAFELSLNNQKILKNIREVTLRALSAQLNLLRVYAEQLTHIQGWLNAAEKLFHRVYETLGYRGMAYIHDMSVWQGDLDRFRQAAVTLSEHVSAYFSMPGIGQSVAQLQQLDAYLNALPEYVRQYKENEGAINAADDFIDTKIAEMARLEQTARDLQGRLSSRFETVMQDSAAFFEAYRSMHEELLDKLRAYQLRVERMAKGGKSVYGSGLQGLLLRVKDRMMKFRSFYRSPVGIITLALLVSLLVAWNIWIQL